LKREKIGRGGTFSYSSFPETKQGGRKNQYHPEKDERERNLRGRRKETPHQFSAKGLRNNHFGKKKGRNIAREIGGVAPTWADWKTEERRKEKPACVLLISGPGK